MLLSVRDRLLLSQTIEPQSGGIITLKLIRKLRENLSLDEEEFKTYRVKQAENWNGGCPKCGGKAIASPPNADPELHCENCSYWGYHGNPQSMMWRTNVNQDKEIEIGDVTREIIVDTLVKLDEKGLLSEQLIDICDKFPEVLEEAEKREAKENDSSK